LEMEKLCLGKMGTVGKVYMDNVLKRLFGTFMRNVLTSLDC
jgi:hypothetical protein